MTVQELFKSLTFDEIVNALRNTHRNEKSINYLSGYKQAFDKLSNINPEGSGGEVTFDITEKEHWFDPGHLPLLANNVEGDYWETIVGKEVIKPENNPFTDAELAGAILWGATFYGFTQHDKWVPYEESYNIYGDMAFTLECKLYRPYIRNKATIERLKKGSFIGRVAFSHDDWNQIHYRQKHQNRLKRMRFHRMGKRIKWLKKLEKRHDLINTIKHSTGLELKELFERIIKAGSIQEYWRESYTFGKTDRITYLKELII